MVYLYVLASCGGVYTPLHGVARSCQKCELCNWGDVPGNDFLSDSAMGMEVCGVYYRGLSCESCKSCK